MENDLDIKNISALKNYLKNIITNLESLEAVAQGTREASNDECEKITQQTECLLQKLEQSQLENFVKLINKRRRQRKKRKKPKQNQATITTPKSPIAKKPKAITKPEKIEVKTEKSKMLKPHKRLRRFKDAQQQLRTFELLKKLHLARSQDVQSTEQFVSQFEKLDAVWNKVLQEYAPQNKPEQRLEQQWREILFGTDETTYCAQRVRLQDFLRIRKIWDSYLVRDEQVAGSSIPNGWILPTTTASPAWTVFLQK